MHLFYFQVSNFRGDFLFFEFQRRKQVKGKAKKAAILEFTYQCNKEERFFLHRREHSVIHRHIGMRMGMISN